MTSRSFDELVKLAVEKHGALIVARTAQVRIPTINAWIAGIEPHSASKPRFTRLIAELLESK